VEESKRLSGRDLNGMVTREAYIALHLRVGRALQSDFDVQASENNANMDWAEDITAFSGEGAPSHTLNRTCTGRACRSRV
jgi:hypothetical protein